MYLPWTQGSRRLPCFQVSIPSLVVPHHLFGPNAQAHKMYVQEKTVFENIHPKSDCIWYFGVTFP